MKMYRKYGFAKKIGVIIYMMAPSALNALKTCRIYMFCKTKVAAQHLMP